MRCVICGVWPPSAALATCHPVLGGCSLWLQDWTLLPSGFSTRWVQPEGGPAGDQRKERLRLHILSLSFPAGLWVGRGLSSYKVKPPQNPKPFSFLALAGGHSAVIIPRGLPHLWGLPSISVIDQFTNSLVNPLKAGSASPRTLAPSQLSLTSLESSRLYVPPTRRKETAHKARICRSLNRFTPLRCHKDRQGIFLPLPGLPRN